MPLQLSTKDKFQVLFGGITGLLLAGLVLTYFLLFTHTDSEEAKIGLTIFTILVDGAILLTLAKGMKTLSKLRKILPDGILVNAQLSETRNSGKDQSGNKRYELTYVYEVKGRTYELHTRSTSAQYQLPTLEVFYAISKPAQGIFIVLLPEQLAEKIRAQYKDHSHES